MKLYQCLWKPAAAVFLTAAAITAAQLSPSAYRALGQPDLRLNGINGVEGMEMSGPSGIALDARGGQVRLYVADTRNHRILAWRDAHDLTSGRPADLVLAQAGPRQSSPLGIGAKGLYLPYGIVVQPGTGDLFVADTGNNRVLRFSSPFEHASRIEPAAVYGQPNFTTRTANSQGIARNSLKAPRGLAFDSFGNLWIADTGNHRVLRYAAVALDALKPEADVVLGQADFNGGAENRSAWNVTAMGFNTPAALAFDQQGNLYVSDLANTRVLEFSPPFGAASAAIRVLGEPNFTSRGVPPQPSAMTIAGPAGLDVDAAGNVFVTAPLENRILMFPPGDKAVAAMVWGQADFSTNQANAGASPLASASSLSGASDVKVDAGGNLFVADTVNNRVLCFPAGQKTGAAVLGQPDFTANGINRIKPGSLNSPYKMAVDYSASPFALYISDTANHRVLVWKDAARFRTGDPADMVIGQPVMTSALPNADGGALLTPSATSLYSPKGIVVDRDGNLYVADSDNNRVLRFPKPVQQSGRITADMVIGQPDFSSSDSAAISASTLHSPSGLAIGPDGNLLVADTGNNRVLEFAPDLGGTPAAVRVYGQTSFTASLPPSPLSAQNFASPQGLFVDGNDNLYVADSGANRILIFPNVRNAPASGMPASIVIGQDRFDTSGAGSGPMRLNSPVDVAVDSSGKLYVSDSGNHRILLFPSLLELTLSAAAATEVIGQLNLQTALPNWNSPDGLATPEGLVAPAGLFIDRRDTLYVCDTGNSRGVQYLKAVQAMSAANPSPSLPVAPGALVSVFGTGIASQTESSTDVPWPVTLAGREVALNDDTRAPLSYTGSSQINLQLPWATPLGISRLVIRAAETGELLASCNILVAPAMPAFFSTSQGGTGQGVITNQDGSANGPLKPALKGSTVQFFGTGQGEVIPAIADGVAAPAEAPPTTAAVPTSDASTCLNRQPSVCIAVGSVMGEIQSSSLAPGMVGVWRLTVKIPENALTGAVPVRAVLNGTPSNRVTITIK